MLLNSSNGFVIESHTFGKNPSVPFSSATLLSMSVTFAFIFSGGVFLLFVCISPAVVSSLCSSSVFVSRCFFDAFSSSHAASSTSWWWKPVDNKFFLSSSIW